MDMSQLFLVIFTFTHFGLIKIQSQNSKQSSCYYKMSSCFAEDTITKIQASHYYKMSFCFAKATITKFQTLQNVILFC